MKALLLFFALHLFCSYTSLFAQSPQEEAHDKVIREYFDYMGTISVFNSNVNDRLNESVGVEINPKNRDKSANNIDTQILKNKAMQRDAFAKLNKIANRMHLGFKDVNGDAERWQLGIALSENLANPFSNAVVRNKWDKLYNTLKWVPGLALTGYTYVTDASNDAKINSIGATVSLVGIIDIFQNIKKKDGSGTALDIVEKGAIAIDATSFYRVGYDDLQEIKSQLIKFKSFMVEESQKFEDWYTNNETPYWDQAPSRYENTDKWNNKIFEEAIFHFEQTDKKMQAFSEIFERVDILVSSKLEWDRLKYYAKKDTSNASGSNLLEDNKGNFVLVDDAPQIIVELYENLKTLKSELESNREKWESYRIRKYKLTAKELKALRSFAELEKENKRLETLKNTL